MMTFPGRASNQKWRFCLGETPLTPREKDVDLAKKFGRSGSDFSQEELNLAARRSD
jgi:hypothetical protein